MGYFDDLEIVQATHKIFGYHVSKPIDPPYLSLCLLRKGEFCCTAKQKNKNGKGKNCLFRSSFLCFRTC